MEISPQLLKSITAKHKEGPLEDFIATELARYTKIEQELLKIAQDEQKEKERYTKAKQALEKNRREIQKRCDHPITKYFADPAGGSDSFCTECQICAEVNRWGPVGYDG